MAMAAPDVNGSSFEQHVVAVNGFAYGVVNADIHVFANGEPLYLLANWRREPDPDPQWLRQMPSRMLNAHRAVVPFTGRADDLAELVRWRDTDPRLAVRWLHGPGGQGKTRLAAQLAAASEDTGWKVAAAFHGPDADRPVPGAHNMSLDGAAGLLMIIDYADRWLLSNLTWLLKNSLLHQVGVRTRIVMVGRGLEAWPAIEGILDAHQAFTSDQRLPDLPADDARATMFAAARDRFAAIYRQDRDPAVTDIGDLPPPDRLDDPSSEFGLTLAVHMAALVAVDAAAHGERRPDDMAALTRYLLNREQLHWRRLHHDGIMGAGGGYRTPPEVMNRAVFVATLTGTMDRDSGVALLKRLRIGAEPDEVLPDRILTDHGVCYPAAEPSATTVLEPLYPDRLAEDFLALTVPGHAVGYPAPPWAPGSLTALLSDLAPGMDGHLTRAITFLGAATDRWRHVGRDHLYPFLRRHPTVAIRAGGTALATLAISRNIDVGLLETLEPLLPRAPHVDLDIAAATITGHVVKRHLNQTTDPAVRARLLAHLAWRLANARRYDEAIGPAEDAATIQRRLAKADPDTHEPELAGTLNNLSNILSGLGRRPEALAVVQSTVTIYRRLAEVDPAVYRPDLAMSSTNLGACLADLGRQEEAVAAFEEAVAIRRRMTAADPATHEPELAASLTGLGNALGRLGRGSSALAAVQESVTILRRAAAAEPDAHRPSLAMSLSNLGNRLSLLNRRAEAAVAAAEAVTIYRDLARVNPEAYRPDLATSLVNLGAVLSEANRTDAAVPVAEEAAAAYRHLASANPAAYLPQLAASLVNLAACLFEQGQLNRALSVGEEAVSTFRQLAGASPDAYPPGFAMSLNNLGTMLAETGRQEEALTAVEEATSIQRRLALANPDAHLSDLAIFSSNLGTRLADLGRIAQAEPAVQEAVDSYRRLASADPTGHLSELAKWLTTLSNHLWRLDRVDDALPPTEESVAIYRKLTRDDPDRYARHLAGTLNNLCDRLSALGRQKQALAAVEEALIIRRRLAELNPSDHLPELAYSLTSLRRLQAELGNRREALAAAEEAMSLYRQLADSDGDTYREDFAKALQAHADTSVSMNADPLRSLKSIQQALEIYVPLALAAPERYGSRVCQALATSAGLMEVLGHADHADRIRRQMRQMGCP